MKRPTLLPLLLPLLLAPALLLAADAIEEYGLDRVQLENSFLGAVKGWYHAPDMATLKALPPDQRAAAVTALGAVLKEYVGSPAFKTEYAKMVKATKPKGLGMLGGLNPSSLLDKGVDKAMGNKSDADKTALDKDPGVTIRKRLQAFLDATADVDFAAETRKSGSLRAFVSQEDEARPPEWKMCYRAGKEATEAARTFAREWLAELTPPAKK